MNRTILLTCLVISTLLFSFQPANIFFYRGSYDNFLREAKKQQKPILLDFWASWCAPCQKMDKETFNDPALTAYINDKYVIYKVNVDTFDGMEIANKFRVNAFPTLLVLSSRGIQNKEIKGFYPADMLLQEIQLPTPDVAIAVADTPTKRRKN